MVNERCIISHGAGMMCAGVVAPKPAAEAEASCEGGLSFMRRKENSSLTI